MIEHPVPQNITAYQFHLIGNMTIKQFLILLVGAGLAFLFYTTNLPGIIKWPLILIFFGGGAMAAFVPYEDRTIDQWIINFVRAIYRPTKYFWRRHPQVPGYFDFKPKQTNDLTEQIASVAPLKQKQIQAYLSSLRQSSSTQGSDPLDIFTNYKDINELFANVEGAKGITPGKDKNLDKPSLIVRTRKLGHRSGVFDANGQLITQAAEPGQKNTQAQTQNFETNLADSVKGRGRSGIASTAVAGQPANQEKSAISKAPADKSDQVKSTTLTDRDHYRGVLKVETLPVEATSNQAKNGISTNQQVSQAPLNQEAYLEAQDTNPAKPENQIPNNQVPEVVFDHSLPFPSLPKEPNVLVGMVYNSQEKIIPGAIIEILDENNNTVRAMKTNALGQFYISSALKPGKYLVKTEKDGFSFSVYRLEINDTVLEPIRIQAEKVKTESKIANNEKNNPGNKQ